MPLAFFITRARHHWDDRDAQITLTEWKQVVEQDSELQFEDPDNPESGVFMHVARWVKGGVVGEPWLAWCEGNITTNGYSAEFIEKMISIARLLSAEVQGDEGDVYVSGTESVPPNP